MDIQEIKNYMRQNKITQKVLSQRSGIPIGTLEQVFSGRSKNPRLDTMNAICDALGLPLELPTQPTILQFNSIYRDTIIVYDHSGDMHQFKFDKDNLDAILKICEIVPTKK